MTRTKMVLSFALAIGALAMTSGTVHAQKGGGKPRTQQNVGQLLSGLLNVNVNVSNITVEDVVDVSNVLNNNQIDILRNAIQRNEVASRNQNVLNNLLRKANLITDNQIVVGVLSGGIPVVINLP